MNQWLTLRRLRAPAFLVLIGIMFLMNEWDVLAFHRSWPLLLILFGVFSLAERAALSRVDPTQLNPAYPQPTYPGGYQPPTGNQAPPTGYQAPPGYQATPGYSTEPASTALAPQQLTHDGPRHDDPRYNDPTHDDPRHDDQGRS